PSPEWALCALERPPQCLWRRKRRPTGPRLGRGDRNRSAYHLRDRGAGRGESRPRAAARIASVDSEALSTPGGPQERRALSDAAMANGYAKGRIKTACGRSTTQAAAPSSKLTACLWQDLTKKRRMRRSKGSRQGIYIARIKAPERHNAHTLCTSFEEQFPER